MSISIHALVKRATTLSESPDLIQSISIHALVKRATVPATRPAERGGNFNPRPREEGDAAAGEVAVEAVISIHALVKRATQIGRPTKNYLYISIHALVKRAT